MAGGIAVLSLLTLRQPNPFLILAGFLLLVSCLVPTYLWLRGFSVGLPLWPVYALMHGGTAALPLLQAPETLKDYTSDEIMVGAFTHLGFLIIGTMAWLCLSYKAPRPPRKVLMIDREHAPRYLLLFLGLATSFMMNNFAGWIQLPLGMHSLVRGVSMSLGLMSLFTLSYYHALGVLNRTEATSFLVMAVVLCLLSAAGTQIAQLIGPIAMIFIGRSLGLGRVPWFLLLSITLIVGILHPGKFSMRVELANQERSLTLKDIPGFYLDWWGAGMEHYRGVLGLVDRDPYASDDPSTLFERMGNLHMLLLVQKKSPAEVPFLNGLTYEQIPSLLVPRFINPEKGLSHSGNILLTVNYGVQSLEQTEHTSIGWGLVPEAYANFGLSGVAFMAALLGVCYAWIARWTANVPITSYRFVVGLVFLASVVRADTLAVFVTMQFQGVIGVSMASLLLMKTMPNTIAEILASASRDHEPRRRPWESRAMRPGRLESLPARVENT